MSAKIPVGVLGATGAVGQKFIKLLKFDPDHPSSKVALQTYAYSTVRAKSYPNLLTQDFTTIAVGAFLVTYDYSMQGTVAALSRFGRSLCQNFPKLQAEGHPKWREVSLSLPDLSPGWTYYQPTAREIRNCVAGKGKVRAKTGKLCSAEERILGLCN